MRVKDLRKLNENGKWQEKLCMFVISYKLLKENQWLGNTTWYITVGTKSISFMNRRKTKGKKILNCIISQKF